MLYRYQAQLNSALSIQREDAMNFDCQVQGNEFVIRFDDGEEVYEGRGASYEEAADEIEDQMTDDDDDQ